MGPSANNFSDRRRPVRRGERPGPPSSSSSSGSRGAYRDGPRRDPFREGAREGGREWSKARPSRGASDPRPAPPFRRRGPRDEGETPIEGRRWSRDRVERPRGEEWRRGEGTGRPAKPGPPADRRPWRFPPRDEAPSRPFRPDRFRGERPPQPSEPPRGEAHAEAAPSDLIWGRHSAQAALESERPIHRVWCTAEMRFRPPFLQLLREAKASGVLVEEVTWARLGQLSGGAVHQGIVLQPAAADTLDLPSLIEGCRQLEESPLLVAVDGLTDPQNLGAILRSAEALGVHGLVLPQRRNAGLTGSVAKVAAGALEHLPVARVVNLNRALETLRQEGYRVVGLDAQGSVSLEEAELEGPLVVITGSEGQGLSLLTRRSCDQLVRIPLRGTTPSLNASVATALVLYEVARRGWMRGLRGMAKPPRLVRPTVPTQPLETAPPAQELLSETQEPLTETLAPLPQAQEAFPQAQEAFPEIQEVFPEIQEPRPEAQEPRPEAKEPRPEAQERLTAAQELTEQPDESAEPFAEPPAPLFTEPPAEPTPEAAAEPTPEAVAEPTPEAAAEPAPETAAEPPLEAAAAHPPSQESPSASSSAADAPAPPPAELFETSPTFNADIHL